MTPTTNDRYLELSPDEPATAAGRYAVDTGGQVHRVDPDVWDDPALQQHHMADGTILASALSAEHATRLYLDRDIDMRPVDVEHETLPTARVQQAYTDHRHRISTLADAALTDAQSEAYVLRDMADCRRKHVATALQREPSTVDSLAQAARENIADVQQTYQALPSPQLDPSAVLELTAPEAQFYVFNDGAVLLLTGEDFYCYECGVAPESEQHELDQCQHTAPDDPADIPTLSLDALVTAETAQSLIDAILDHDRAFEEVVERIDDHRNFTVVVE